MAACASLVALLALVLLSATAAAAPLAASDGLARPTFDRTVVFQLKPDADSSAVLAAATEWGDVVDTPLMALGIYTIVPTTVGASELRAALGRVDGVLWVEPERLVEALAAPNDPRFWDQAALLTMQVARAWEMSPGSWSVIVGVVDSGVGPHPDLAGRVLPGHSVIDSARPDDTTDHSGHGTAVAGIIAAGVNDHSGVAGVTQRVRILPVVVLQSDGSGSDVDTAAGIVWAVDHGADVINLSLGATFYSRPLAEAVRYAYERGVVLVAAVGNDGSVGVRYPAAFPEVIAVGATNSSDQHVTSSNPGPEVDVAAPGVAVLSTGFSDFTHTAPTVLAFSGTSFSAALVTGLAALIVSKDPSLTPRAVSSLIEGGAKDVDIPGRDEATGAGRVDAAASLALMLGGPVPGDVTAPRAPLLVSVTTPAGDPLGRAVKVESPLDADRAGVMVRRTLVRPARDITEGVLVGAVDTTRTTVDLTDTLHADGPPGCVYYYTGFALDASGNASNPAWAYSVAPGGDPPPLVDPPPPPPFYDVPASYAFAGAISALADAGIVAGFGDGSFRPDDPVTRAQFAKMVVLSVGISPVSSDAAATFSDVPSGAGYPFVYVEAAAAAGIVKGFPTATPSEVPRFGPYENVLRIQVAQMLARAGSEKLDPPPPGIVHPFYDAPSYAEAELAPIWQMGIIKGRSSVVYDPWTPATRGQVAEMLFRLRSVFQARP